METLAERTRLPAELLDGAARLTLTLGGGVRIENHDCLLSYAPDVMEIACGKRRLRLRGEGLRICGMDRAELLIEGRILAVEVDGG